MHIHMLWEILLDRRVYLRKLTNEREFPTFCLKPERIKSSTTLVQRDTEILNRVNSFPSKLLRKTTSVTLRFNVSIYIALIITTNALDAHLPNSFSLATGLSNQTCILFTLAKGASQRHDNATFDFENGS